MKQHHSGDIVWLAFKNLSHVNGLAHAVSTRTGGVSKAPFNSLNLGFHVGDDERAVVENRGRFARAVGLPLDGVVATRQVHGVCVRAVKGESCGTGVSAPPAESWACDALVTGEAGVFLMGFSADCPLVMLVDEPARVVALAHAGWRSAFGGILARTVAEMKRLGADPSRISAGISPAIGPCCYEVGRELRDQLARTLDDAGRFFAPHGESGEKFLLDLPAVCRELLKREGVRDGSIEAAGMCTACNETLLYSYRKSGGETGRHSAVIGWKR